MVWLLVVDFSPGWAHFGPLLGTAQNQHHRDGNRGTLLSSTFSWGVLVYKAGGNDYKYSKRPFFVQGPLILSGSGGCCV